MRPFRKRQNRSLCLLALLWAVFLLFSRVAEGRVPFPPVPESPELAWERQVFFRDLPEWNMDSPGFPWVPSPAELRNAESDASSQGGPLFRHALARERSGGTAEESARLYMRAYAADRSGETGFVALKQAARLFFRDRRYMEASDILGRLIERSGKGSSISSFNLLKGEALARMGNHLAARESFRRASGGRWDDDTRRRIGLRIADMSFLMGNIAYAEPLYRKLLAGADAPRKFPYESIRFGETLLSTGKSDEALGIFRKVRDGSASADAGCASLLGEGDALLLRKDLAGARFAYEQAGGRATPTVHWWILLRKADIESASGGREAASASYRNLATCPLPDVAREAAYKWVLARFLLSDYETVLKESQAYLGRFAGKPGDSGMRTMAARAGAAFVAEISRKHPADRWTALTEYLFAYGRAPEGKALYRAIGTEWETAGLWGGAAALYFAAGDAAASRSMLRIEAAEKRYWEGDLQGAASELNIRNPAAETSRPALRLLARIRFREGRYEDAAKLLVRIGAMGPATEAGKETAAEREKEFLAFARALQGKWTDSVGMMKGSGPAPAQNDLYSAYERSQERYRRLLSDGGGGL